ncbi:TPA: hypothetical protein N0F65_011078 [Lagenidium giganteum]|uniref:Gamma-glutamylcyclotransferase family protein n=1 Tax=Lagenidium giganteum TaxID=4803 RepID=A0AAV2ZF83_9STRA|nr:TPA: hypothetical protein N0F65_011078 [Lagenidium giganteum]
MTASGLDTLVFVYGTLKRDLYNYNVYLKPAVELNKAAYAGTAITADPEFVLVLKKNRTVPCMFRETEKHAGYKIPGELFRVDKDALECLDLLEGVAGSYYLRETIDVEVLDGDKKGQTVPAQAYIVPRNDEMMELTHIPEYTTQHHEQYIAKSRTPKLHYLQHIYGEDKMTQVRAKIDAGMEFDDAWVAIMGKKLGPAP